ncbi:MAG: 4-hydroxy-tetrahydrodipicolinate reductase [Thermacetogeniaceae bacterium]
MNELINVIVAGAAGKMGQEVVKTVLRDPDLVLAGAIDIKAAGQDAGKLVGLPDCGILISNSLQAALHNNKADVLVDFTNAQAAANNAKTALKNGIFPIIGATGLDEAEIDELRKIAKKTKIGVLIVPNFTLGAVLMMDFARQAARYFPNVEIIELHHDQKVDAPSGTALLTAQSIDRERKPFHQGHPQEYEKLVGARGGDWNGIRLHSVRLPGLVAHQEVIFGGPGQMLTIRHDSISRESFMPGVTLAIKKVRQLQGVNIGLETVLS